MDESNFVGCSEERDTSSKIIQMFRKLHIDEKKIFVSKCIRELGF